MQEQMTETQGQVSELQEQMAETQEQVSELQGQVSELQEQMTETQGDICIIKGAVHQIKDVNLTSIIKLQMEFSKQQKETNKKLDKYLEKNEVEHKKFECEIANSEWKNKIAN